MVCSKLPIIHPGEILREEYLFPLGMSAYALAKELHVPRTRIERIVALTTPITTDTALRLAKFFNTTPHYWLNMQNIFDLQITARSMQNELNAIHQFEAAE